MLAAYDRSLAELQRLGAEIVPVELPFRFADDEAMALRIGFAWQQASDWYTRRPF